MQWWKNFEKYPQRCTYLSIIWLLLVNGLAFLWHLGSTGLVDETEPLFAEAARQMVETGDWVTPYFNGETRFDKPPLVYWLMAIGYKLIGVNEWAVRLPSALAAIALVILGFFTLRDFGFPRPGGVVRGNLRQIQHSKSLWLSAWIASGLMAFNLQTLVWARTGVSDMLLSGCMGCALFCFFWGYASREDVFSQQSSVISQQMGNRGAGETLLRHGDAGTRGHGEEEEKTNDQRLIPNGWYLACYILLALAVLTKGPVGIVLPGLTILLFLLYVGKFWEVAREMGVIVGGIIFLGLTLPWYILVTLENGQGYIDSFFGYHNFERFTEVVNGHGAPWYFYFLVVLVGCLPWSVYLPIAIARLRFWQRSHWQQQPRTAQLGIFALCWFIAIFVFFTIAVTKLPSYTLPLIPAAAILVALFWSQELTISTPDRAEHKRNWGFLATGMVNAIFLLALAIVSIISPQLIGYDAAAPNLGELLGQTGLPIRSGIIWGGTSVAIAGLLWQRKTQRWILAANLIGFIAFLVFVLTPANLFVDRVRQLPIRELGAIAVQVQQLGEELIMSGFKKPSLVFYTQNPVKFFYGKEDTLAYLQQTTNDPSHSPTVLLFSQSTAFSNTFELEPNDYENLGQNGVYQLIRVHKQILRDRAIQ